jgi:hypothetical protein
MYERDSLDIFVKFGIGNMCENVTRNSKFRGNWKAVSGTLHEDLNMFILFSVEWSKNSQAGDF